jgi:hypothetical protein
MLREASGGGCRTEEREGGQHRRLEGGAWEETAGGIQMRSVKGRRRDGLERRNRREGAAAGGIWERKIRVLMVFI